ncbi:MAG: MotE family protein [Steroidobacteraceae bacterium]
MSRLRMPRLLPVAIPVMALVLGMKCVGLADDVAGAAETKLAADAPAAKPVPMPVNVKLAAAPQKPAEDAVAAAQKLASGRAKLAAEEAALRARQSVVAAAEQKLDQRVAELKALQATLEKEQAARLQQQDQHWQNLVKLYARMKPRDAARILDGMDTKVVVALIARMKEIRAAPILAAMSPVRARDVTAVLADHRQTANAAPVPQ